MVIRYKDATVRRGDNIEIRNYITKDMSSSFSLAVSKLNGLHPRTMNVVSDRAYYIIEGKGTVIVADEENTVQAGDAVYIPKNTPHSIEGQLTYVLLNAPSFDPANETKPV